MNVLIINPPWPGKGFGTRSQNRIIKHRSDKYLQYPIFLAYSAAQLKETGCNVSYIDSVIQDLDLDQTISEVKKKNPDIIFMETTTPSIEADYVNLTELKNATNAKIIVGGPHVTYFHKKVIEDCKAIDIVIRHEFDTKIANVVSNINDLNNVPGITFRSGDDIIDNGDGELPDNLDTLPLPDRETVPWHWYVEAWYSRQPFMNMMTSRGCPYHCAFCLWPQIMNGHKQRFRSIDNVIHELKHLVNQYGLKEINIDDGTFTTNKKRVIEFCQRLRKEKLDLIWTCNGRVDNIDDEMLIEMKKSGCKMIRFGVESGSQEVLNKIKKGLTLEQIEKGISMVKKHGIQALGGFMFGFPYDSKKTIEQTINFAKKLSPDQVQFSINMCYPGTSLYEYAIENNLLLAGSFKEFDMTYGPVVKTVDMERAELEHVLSKAYREFYFRPGYILQTLLHLRDIDEIRRVFRSLKSLLNTIKLHK
ncbi:MAG: radical SAM protein [Desulfobacterales bacterium]|jgi:anaerobic magnesium-protoporphyrin IX monomethyl ester cyclase|nr:radical SAM protein [Desulfobacteraceae bacterium]MBT7086745.1 radical SAM protein [Desulfobacterales bacterium]